MKKKLLSLALALAMALTLLPTAALAEGECAGSPDVQDCQADEHIEGCLKYKAAEENDPSTPPSGGDDEDDDGSADETPVCDGTKNCPVTDKAGHKDNCYKLCTGKTDCPNDTTSASYHQADCLKLCTGKTDCKNTQGRASAHQDGCPMAQSSLTCDGTKDCPVTDKAGHDRNCYKLCTGKTDCPNDTTSTSYHQADCLVLCTKDKNCKNTQGKASAHQDGCPMAAAAGKISHCLWENGYVYWDYTPADSTASVDSSKFHIKVASKTVTPSVTSATFTVSGTSISGYKFPLEQTSGAQKVEIYYDTETGTTGTCTVPALEVDTSKAIDPTNVKYNPKTGALSWTMKDITASTAVFTANDDFYVEFRTKTGKSAGSTIQLTYVPSGSGTTAANPITISGSTYSATVSQPTNLDEGVDYIISVQNRRLSAKVDCTFTAVGLSELVLDLPKAGDVTASNVKDVIEQLDKIGADTLAAALVNSENVKNFTALSQAVGRAMDLTTTKSVATNANTAFLDNQSRIQMQGAENSATQSGATMKLEVGPSERSSELLALPSETGYENADKVTFSMTLTQVKGNDTTTLRSLSVPVLVTLPVPENISMRNAVVLHYSTRGVYDRKLVTTSITNSTRTITVAATGFSDFVITENTTVNNAAVSTDTITDTTPAAPAPSAPSGFPDVPASSTFAAPIAWAQQNGILGGYSDGTFRPNNSTTRQALWMVLARMSGASPANMAEARAWSMNSGISDGTNPGNPLTRQQLITMLYRFAQKQGVAISGSADLSGYPDNSAVANYAKEALAWGVGNGIITGTNEGKLNPQGTATRAHFAAFLYRYANL